MLLYTYYDSPSEVITPATGLGFIDDAFRLVLLTLKQSSLKIHDLTVFLHRRPLKCLDSQPY